MVRRKMILSTILIVILLSITDLLASGDGHGYRPHPRSTLITNEGYIDASNLIIQKKSGRGSGNQQASDIIMTGTSQSGSTSRSTAVQDIMGTLVKSGTQGGKCDKAFQKITGDLSAGGGQTVATGPGGGIAQGGGGSIGSSILNTRSGGPGYQSAIGGGMVIVNQFSATPKGIASNTAFSAVGTTATQAGRGVKQTQIVNANASAGGGTTIN